MKVEQEIRDYADEKHGFEKFKFEKQMGIDAAEDKFKTAQQKLFDENCPIADQVNLAEKAREENSKRNEIIAGIIQEFTDSPEIRNIVQEKFNKPWQQILYDQFGDRCLFTDEQYRIIEEYNLYDESEEHFKTRQKLYLKYGTESKGPILESFDLFDWLNQRISEIQQQRVQLENPFDPSHPGVVNMFQNAEGSYEKKKEKWDKGWRTVFKCIHDNRGKFFWGGLAG
jgi:hypothetical protein